MGTLYNKYQKKAVGGTLQDPQSALSSGVGLISGLGSGLTDVFRQGRTPTVAGGALTGALSGAAAGSQFGIVGAGVGAGLGLVTGALTTSKRKRLEKASERSTLADSEMLSQEAGRARIASNPSLVEGNQKAEFFANGGLLDDGGPKPKKKPTLDKDWDGLVEKANGTIGKWGNDIPEAPAQAIRLYPKGTIQSEDITYLKSLNDSTVNRGLRKTINKPGETTQYGQDNSDMFKALLAKRTKKFALGGQLKPMSKNSVEVDGPSHANGGVQIPEAGAEVEGGETISNGFVFSERLGFAQLHKPIAKAIGKIEQKNQTPDRTKALEILQKKEQALMLSQEYFKKKNGIASELNI